MEPSRLFALPDVDLPARSPTDGQISELAAAVKLLERGHKVARPLFDDDGVDLVVDYRIKVQIKSTGSLKRDATHRKGRFFFEFRVGRKDGLRNASNAERVRGHHRVDVFVFHSTTDDLWWVVPASAIGGSHHQITPGGRFDRRWRDAWEVFQST